MAHPSRFAAELVRSGIDALAAGTVLRQRGGGAGGEADLAWAPFGSLQADTAMRLRYLAEALWADRPALLYDHLAWTKVAQSSRGVGPGFLLRNLECMREELGERLPDAAAVPARAVVGSALEALPDAPESLPSLVEGGEPQAVPARRWLAAALEGRRRDALAVLEEGLERGVGVAALQQTILLAQTELGRMWQCDEIHVGEEHLASALAEDGLALLRRAIPEAGRDAPRMLVASAQGDLHALGVRLVADRFASGGWRVRALGANVPPPDLVRSALDLAPDVIVLTAQLGLQVRAIAGSIAALRGEPATARLPVLVGGHPFRVVDDLWEVVGADAGARDLDAGVVTARSLLTRPA